MNDILWAIMKIQLNKLETKISVKAKAAFPPQNKNQPDQSICRT